MAFAWTTGRERGGIRLSWEGVCEEGGIEEGMGIGQMCVTEGDWGWQCLAGM